MIKKLLTSSLLFFCVLPSLISQNNHPKQYFDKAGHSCSDNIAYYYRVESDTAGFYRSFYSINGKIYFQGAIKTPSTQDENKNIYTGTCSWHYKNGNLKMIRSFNEKGEESGTSRYYYESGKIWKEIEYHNGKYSETAFVEYNENGSKNKIFEENFDNNHNEWDLYVSDKSTASISNGIFEIISTSKEGTSRYINHAVESDEWTLEAVINIKDVKETDKIGVIYGFKDWQNYNYFVISKKNIYVGGMYEGVKDVEVDAMYSSAINSLENNTIKILSNGDKSYFSVNGEIQYTSKANKLFGNNYGFVLSGNTKLRVDKFTIKEIGVSGSGIKNSNADDREVKSFGSGVIISSGGYIITNHHVVENASKLVVDIVENSVKKEYKAEVVSQDKDNDLAILKIKDERFTNLPPIKYSFKENGQLDVGAMVFTIGYPHALTGMGKDAKFTDGKISAKTGYDGAINSFQSTIAIQPGNSGGPVFNDAGQLIGVVNSTIRNTENVAYTIKLNYIKNLIEVLPDKVDLPADNAIKANTLEEQIKVLMNYVVLIKVK
ncbi:MAG: trypsin-like peptidase domain-containing protein [Bacteroidetes bacterium]|nr:trypsin-like peptidase domain-containing protein [Bacteroidota bacterium]